MSTLILWVLAGLLGLLVLRRQGAGAAAKAVRKAVDRGVRVLPRLVVAVLAAGFVAMLIPSGVVAEHIGPESGVSGVLIAMLVGGFIPSGPIVSFPLVVVLHEAGAGTPQLVALLTAWSCFALHRVMIYEIPLMGLRFGVTRLVSALPLPLISAGITAALLAALG